MKQKTAKVGQCNGRQEGHLYGPPVLGGLLGFVKLLWGKIHKAEVQDWGGLDNGVRCLKE